MYQVLKDKNPQTFCFGKHVVNEPELAKRQVSSVDSGQTLQSQSEVILS